MFPFNMYNNDVRFMLCLRSVMYVLWMVNQWKTTKNREEKKEREFDECFELNCYIRCSAKFTCFMSSVGGIRDACPIHQGFLQALLAFQNACTTDYHPYKTTFASKYRQPSGQCSCILHRILIQVTTNPCIFTQKRTNSRKMSQSKIFRN